MKDIREIVCAVIDRGIFFPIAERLARDYAKVYYHKPNGELFETVSTVSQGAGWKNIEYADDIWEIKNKVDLFVFPDCCDWGLQKELESQGFPVWGSKDGGKLEQFRGRWLDLSQSLDMPMPKTVKIRGLTNLDLYLKEHQDERLFIKISRFRGDMETWEAKTPSYVQNQLNYLRTRFGPLSEHVIFYVQSEIETDIESGIDTFNIWGQWPEHVIEGYEKKDQGYFATVKKRDELPDELWAGKQAITPLLKEMKYANFLSSEDRIKDKIGYWLDPTMRCPSPAGEEQLEMYENLPEIILKGAHGELVEPDFAAQFCGEAVILHEGDDGEWRSVEVPDEIKQWIKLYACAYADGSYHFSPYRPYNVIGCAVAIGDTPQEVLDKLKELVEAMKGQPVNIGIDSLAALFSEIDKAEDEGIPFSDEPVPEPAEVIEDE